MMFIGIKNIWKALIRRKSLLIQPKLQLSIWDVIAIWIHSFFEVIFDYAVVEGF